MITLHFLLVIQSPIDLITLCNHQRLIPLRYIMCYYIIYAPQWLIHFVTDIEEVFDASNPQKLFHVREGRISEAFPNVDTAFRLYFTESVAKTEGDRSFSALKRVKEESTAFNCWPCAMASQAVRLGSLDHLSRLDQQ